MVILCKLLWRFSLYWLESLHYWWYHSFLHELLDHLAFLWLYDSISLEFFHLYHLETFHNFYFVVNLNPIQDGLFRGCSRIRGAKRAPLPKIFHTYPTMMKLGTVIPYLKKIKKNVNHVIHLLSSANMSSFSPGFSKFCYIKKYRYGLHFNT